MSSDPADTLYHYTSASGLIGIVNDPTFPRQYRPPRFDFTRTLRVFGTDVRYLNDTQELSYAGKIFGERFARVAKDGSIGDAVLDDRQKTLLHRLSDDLKASKFYGEPVQVFAACWSADGGDRLSQWRGYGQGIGGYSIGISKDVAIMHTRYLPPHDAFVAEPVVGLLPNTVVKVSYDRADAERAADEAVARVVSHLHTVTDPDQAFMWGRWAAVMTMAHFKHDGFSDEQEWRMINQQSPRPPRQSVAVEFRTGAAGVIPFQSIAVNFGDSLQPAIPRPDVTIVDLVVGPSPDQRARATAAKQLLETNGHDPDVVRRSKIPFRG